jgi:hypothetical protein
LEESMTTRALVLVLTAAALAGISLTGSTAMALPPQPIPTCSPGPSDCSAWHTADVTVTWSTSQCAATTITSDTGGTAVGCTAKDANGSVTTTVIVRRDATPPSVRGTPTRGPDSNGWYNRAVPVEFQGTDALSGIGSCTTTSYAGPDSGTAKAAGSCNDYAGNTGTGTYELKYDATAPTVAAKPERNPNAAGWYNRPVSVAFVGTDPVSGVDSCSPTILYKGPDTPKTSLSGTCRDKASNMSVAAGLDLKYDTVPPRLARAKVAIGRRGVALRWAASTDARSYAVVRRPGLRGKKPSTIYTGRKRTFTDRRLENGVKYRYTVWAYDEAGNGTAKALVAHPKSVAVPTRTEPARSTPAASKPALTSPAPGARISAPPLLTWAAVPQATYYNVQIYRDGKKVLTAWIRHPKLRLAKSWRYEGRRYALSPGVYRWYVWPGFDLPAANRYGKLVGTRTFVVRKR